MKTAADRAESSPNHITIGPRPNPVNHLLLRSDEGGEAIQSLTTQPLYAVLPSLPAGSQGGEPVPTEHSERREDQRSW